MKKFIFISLISLFLAVPVWAGYTVTTPVSEYGPYFSGPGGEFTLTPGGGLEVYLNNYSSLAKDQGGYTDSFQTFCLETTEYITTNHTYNVKLNTNAVMGGTLYPGDPVSVGTAYLYSQFARGTLSGYDYSDTGVGRTNSAKALQHTIWWLEGAASDPGPSNIFQNLVTTMFTDPSVDNLNAGVLQFPVLAMNLTNSDDPYQDQLILVPIPATILLGLFGLGIGGWKFRKSL